MQKLRYLVASVLIASLVAVLAQPAGATFPDEQGPWADIVFSSLPGLTKAGGEVPNHDAWQALGEAESVGNTTYDAPLGSAMALGYRGQVTLGFTNTILNQVGPDFQLFELKDASKKRADGRFMPFERVKVEASENGWQWYTVAGYTRGDAKIDLGRLRWAKFVQITDRTPIGLFPNDSDGYNLDGVMALHSTIDQPWKGEAHDTRYWRIDDQPQNDVWLDHSVSIYENGRFCNSLWDQAVTFHNNYEANWQYNGVAFQDAKFYSVNKVPTMDGQTVAQIHERLSTMTCLTTSKYDRGMNDLLRSLDYMNRGQFIWYSPDAANAS